MTFNVPSFFAGVGTVLLTLIVGFGGGVLMTGMFTDRPREPNKLERRATEEIRPAPEAKPPTIVAGPVIATPVPAPQPVAEQPVPAAQTPAKRAEPPAEPPKAAEPPKTQPAEPKPPG